ncbi:MAG: hypothetical protein ACREBE_07410, partial [bacterium]
DNATALGATNTTGFSISSYAMGAVSNGVLHAGTHHYNSPVRTVSSITFGAANLTAIAGAGGTQNIFAGVMSCDVWEKRLPTAGSAAVAITYSGTVQEAVLFVASYGDVDQTTPYGAVTVTIDATHHTLISGTAASTATSLVAGYCVAGDEGGTQNPTGTALYQTVSNSGGTRGLGQRKNGTGGNVTLDWTDGGTQGITGFILVAFAINYGAAAAATSRPVFSSNRPRIIKRRRYI